MDKTHKESRLRILQAKIEILRVMDTFVLELSDLEWLSALQDVQKGLMGDLLKNEEAE